MVMTLRKRAPPPPVLRSSPSTSPERETISRKRKTKKPIRGKPKPESESGSELESSGSELDDSEKENDGCEYEKCREQRIRENKERMEKLGIFSLSSQMFGNSKRGRPTKKKSPKKKSYNPLLFPRPPRSPRRRSDRVKNVGQAHYLENERVLKEMGISIPDGWKTEVYTEEDEKLLGNCEKEWTLEVDGFGEDGDLLYDPVSGTSCHQCRYKTLRKHTYCHKCRSGQGQLCGDCLYTRYGENVLEAVENPTWLCPACRGICNCSRCRQAKGWSRVTIQYAKVVELGFKSVAHYLILNRRAGNLPKEPEDGTVMADATEGEGRVSLHDDCSDTSAEWLGSDSDDEVSKATKKKADKSTKKQADIVEPEVLNEPAGIAVTNEVLQESNYQHLTETKRELVEVGTI